ncbi:MAG: hypothetical protein ACI37O_04265 [Candidatus Avelusimicrobium sp.]|uniref:hypothetical protein n=1 Tax=Candidatus Avelusimicrobium sp. TaxID=3048833 RepID=UPI003F0C4EB3
MKTKKIYQGNDTGLAGGSLFLLVKTNIPDLTGFSAELTIDGTDFKRTFDGAALSAGKLSFNITAEESLKMPLGYHESALKITDPQGRVKTVLTDTVFEVRRPQYDD